MLHTSNTNLIFYRSNYSGRSCTSSARTNNLFLNSAFRREDDSDDAHVSTYTRHYIIIESILNIIIRLNRGGHLKWPSE